MADDVQGLLRKVEVQPADDLSEHFPREMPCRLHVLTKSGECEVEKRDYEGFSTRPIYWERATEKFERLAAPYANGKLRDSIAYTVRHVEDVEPERWEEFKERYRAELEEADKMEEVREISDMAEEGNVTLIFGTKDTEYNNARSLESFNGRRARP